MATLSQVRNPVVRRPFRPFLIRLGDGRTYSVRHPELVAVSPRGRELVFVGDDEGIHEIDMMLVAGIETPGQIALVDEGNG